MTKLELLDALASLGFEDNAEMIHINADDLLLKFIGDMEITEAYEKLPRWYS